VIGRPEKSEASPYFFRYIDRISDDDVLGVLDRQSQEILAFLGGFSEERSRHRYAPGKWSVRQVWNHVNDVERLFLFRALWFARGLAGGLPGFEQDTAAAAARADEDAYFAFFTPDAVFLGTDPTERWTRDTFRQWAHPRFAKGKAWEITSTHRWISVSGDGNVAWFDEDAVSTTLGPVRGSGVLVRVGGAWKIAQYNLSVPIPNDRFDAVKRTIQAP